MMEKNGWFHSGHHNSGLFTTSKEKSTAGTPATDWIAVMLAIDGQGLL